ncbi:retrotransposon protein, putative, ty1-copia subclass [Tanacetum coccineum]
MALLKDLVGFVRNYNIHNMGKKIGEIHTLLIEYEKGLPKKAETPQVMMIKSGKIQKANKKSLKAKGKNKGNGKGQDKKDLGLKRKLKQGAFTCSVGNCVRATSRSNRNFSFKECVLYLMLFLEMSMWDLNEPTSYKAAMLDSESNKWIDAMNAEIQSMMDNMVWVLVDLPPGCKTVGSRWLFKKKTDMDGIVHVYKARLVAKGYTQLYGVDYEETFSPVADIRAIRILISIAAYYDYEIWQMDVKTAFLNGYLDEDIYMVQPEGFVDPNHPRKVCKLQRSIYGLKQASRSWNKRFDEEIKSLQSVKDYLGKCFAMKDLGEAAFILGIKIYRDRSKRLIGLCQNAYMDKILKRYKMDNSKRGHIPMQERLDLTKSTSSAAVHMLNNRELQKGARHYQRRYHYVREYVELGEIRILKVHTDNNLADPFTKALSNRKLTQHARGMGLRPASSFM